MQLVRRDHSIEVLCVLGHEDHVDRVVPDELGNVRKPAEHVAFALQDAAEVPEIPALGHLAGARRFRYVADGVVGRFVSQLVLDVDEAELGNARIETHRGDPHPDRGIPRRRRHGRISGRHRFEALRQARSSERRGPGPVWLCPVLGIGQACRVDRGEIENVRARGVRRPRTVDGRRRFFFRRLRRFRSRSVFRADRRFLHGFDRGGVCEQRRQFSGRRLDTKSPGIRTGTRVRVQVEGDEAEHDQAGDDQRYRNRRQPGPADPRRSAHLGVLGHKTHTRPATTTVDVLPPGRRTGSVRWPELSGSRVPAAYFSQWYLGLAPGIIGSFRWISPLRILRLYPQSGTVHTHAL